MPININMEQLAMEIIVSMYLRESHKNIATYLKLGYLTIKKGRDGRDYAWYIDEFNSVICDVETLELCDDGVIIEALFC